MKGRLNKDIELGIRIGLMRGAAMIEKRSQAGEKSTFAIMLKENANHQEMKTKHMENEGKFINGGCDQHFRHSQR